MVHMSLAPRIWASGRSCEGSGYHLSSGFGFPLPKLRGKTEKKGLRKNLRQRLVSTSSGTVKVSSWILAGDTTNFSSAVMHKPGPYPFCRH